MDVKDLASDLEHYNNCLSVCHRHYYDLPEELSHANDIGDEVFKRNIVDKLPHVGDLRTLGIGSGNGDLDCVFFGRLLQSFKSIKNTVIEPSHDSVEKYKLNLSHGNQLLSAVTSEWHKEGFEEWHANSSNKRLERYHFISAVHSLYYVEDVNDTLNKLLAMLEDGGLLFIVVTSDDTAVYLMSQHFKSFCDDFHVSAVSKRELLPNIDGNLYETTVFKRSNMIDISCCFDETSEDGSLLLDFITQVKNFRTRFCGKILNETLETLKSPTYSLKSGDGRILAKDDWDVMVVKKK